MSKLTFYDKKFHALVESFLLDHFDLTATELAQHTFALSGDIQDAVETYVDFMRERAAEKAAHDNDPHERAAARARANDFEDTDRRDWT